MEVSSKADFRQEQLSIECKCMFNVAVMPTTDAKNSSLDVYSLKVSCLLSLLNRKNWPLVDEKREISSNGGYSETGRKGTARKTCTFTIFT